MSKPTLLFTARHSAPRQAQCYFGSSRTFNQPRQPAFARLLNSLAVLEQRDGKLQSASLSAISAARKLGGSITGFVAGKEARSVAEEAAKVKGVEKIIVVENGAYEKVRSLCRLPLNYSRLLLTLC